jgi:hypothetical protein
MDPQEIAAPGDEGVQDLGLGFPLDRRDVSSNERRNEGLSAQANQEGRIQTLETIKVL